MKNNEAKILAADLETEMPELDLHGLYPNEAKERVELFLYKNYQDKVKMVRLIYGAGTGKLQEVVVEYLQNHPLVDIVVDKGGNAVAVLDI